MTEPCRLTGSHASSNSPSRLSSVGYLGGWRGGGCTTAPQRQRRCRRPPADHRVCEVATVERPCRRVGPRLPRAGEGVLDGRDSLLPPLTAPPTPAPQKASPAPVALRPVLLSQRSLLLEAMTAVLDFIWTFESTGRRSSTWRTPQNGPTACTVPGLDGLIKTRPVLYWQEAGPEPTIGLCRCHRTIRIAVPT